MKIYEHKAIIIGSGCAGYNCADRLYEYGIKDIAIVTEGRLMGTSRNTGSDKQTYYKMSLAGDEGDSVMNMAQTLFSGGAVDGEIALCEAANSVPSFLKLVGLGVQFPTNDYGEYVGYKTDHDPFQRATSIGPYTSKRMTEVLESAVMAKNIPIYDNCQVIKILKENGRAVGVLALNVLSGEYIAVKAPNVVLATGGPAAVYFDSVYPESQTGASALAIEAGAEFVNLAEWQYGLASTDFRWNVSGTYQQVLPRYISVDREGVEREFLTEYFSDTDEMLKNIFLKGYEWPFDVRKIYGSSYIDLLVYRESVIRGRTVYMDFTREPSGMEKGFDSLDPIVYSYLKNSDALLPTPIARLKKMNSGAVSLYREHGIDLETQPLKIAVCAQHNNGGVRVDENWQTSVPGLYACGEVAGTFGVFRPGGSALNSSQVGSMRAARHIAYFSTHFSVEDFEGVLSAAVQEAEELKAATRSAEATLVKKRTLYQKSMSEYCAFIRDADKMREHLDTIRAWQKSFCKDNKWSSPLDVFLLFKNKELLLTQEMVTVSMIESANRYGSRGSAFVLDGTEFMQREPKKENEAGRKRLLIVAKKGTKLSVSERETHPIPARELWFEKVWNKFNSQICKEH